MTGTNTLIYLMWQPIRHKIWWNLSRDYHNKYFNNWFLSWIMVVWRHRM